MRRRKTNKHLPPCVHLHHGAYYYIKSNVWKPLGKDLTGALAQYAKLVEGPKDGGMGRLISQALPVICRDVKPSTAAQYRIAGNKLSRALAQFEPDQVLPKHLAAIKLAMADRPNMANRVLTVARLIFAYALENQLASINPAIGVKRHKERKRDRLPLPAEVEAIKQHAGPRLSVVIDLLRFTGQRTNDVLRLRESAITAAGITFRQQKTGATLTVGWNKGLRETVDRARALHGQIRSLYLLPSRVRGKAPDYRSVKLQWDEACKAAKVENLHLHDLRAMAATQARMEGKDAQALMGHASASQTATYLRDKATPIVQAPEY